MSNGLILAAAMESYRSSKVWCSLDVVTGVAQPDAVQQRPQVSVLQARILPRVFEGDEPPVLSSPTTKQAGADRGAGRTATSKGDPCTAAPSRNTSTFCAPVWTHRTTALRRGFRCTLNKKMTDAKYYTTETCRTQQYYTTSVMMSTSTLLEEVRGSAGHRVSVHRTDRVSSSSEASVWLSARVTVSGVVPVLTHL